MIVAEMNSGQSIAANRTHLTFLAPGDVLKGRVEPTIWMRMCNAFATKGMDVDLVTVFAYRNENVPRSRVFEHYGLREKKFNLTILPTPFDANPSLYWYRSWTGMTNFIYASYRMLAKSERSRFDRVI